jgi:tRNA-splicing endonuclease subunit Sen34
MDASEDLDFDYTPELPIAISCVAGRYLLFDIKIATWLRRQHNICGITIGSLPLAPSQNLFLGIPVEIMPEEAQLLVERGIGFVVDDARAHDQAIHSANNARRADYLERLRKQTKQIETLKIQEKAESRKRGLEKQSRKATASTGSTLNQPSADLLDFNDSEDPPVQESRHIPSSSNDNSREDPPNKHSAYPSSSYGITPATSNHLLPPPDTTTNNAAAAITDLPTSYPLYRHLHDKGYFMNPGLRFGCQYVVYPGDTLRYHSHFLAVGRQWEEEIDLMDIVGGGRLGTGVKKGFLFGGESPRGDVRTFSVEWAAM